MTPAAAVAVVVALREQLLGRVTSAASQEPSTRVPPPKLSTPLTAPTVIRDLNRSSFSISVVVVVVVFVVVVVVVVIFGWILIPDGSSSVSSFLCDVKTTRFEDDDADDDDDDGDDDSDVESVNTELASASEVVEWVVSMEAVTSATPLPISQAIIVAVGEGRGGGGGGGGRGVNASAKWF